MLLSKISVQPLYFVPFPLLSSCCQRLFCKSEQSRQWLESIFMPCNWDKCAHVAKDSGIVFLMEFYHQYFI